jgi:polysaccharide pyruvyl transferase WcaK-like protein
VKPSVAKWIARNCFGAYKESHYSSVYFHNSGAAVDAAYKKYLGAIAGAVNTFRAKQNVFPILVAMERLDAKACEALAPQLGGAPVFTSDAHDMYELVSVLRCCSLMVSSRYHAMVTSMPGLVPSAGITMDERIRNLLRERGHDHLLLTVDDPDLEAQLLLVMERLVADADAIREGIARSVVRNLKTMARMGVFLERAVHECYPDFPVRSGVHGWEEYLPPLSPTLERLLETYEGAAAAAAGS